MCCFHASALWTLWMVWTMILIIADNICCIFNIVNCLVYIGVSVVLLLFYKPSKFVHLMLSRTVIMVDNTNISMLFLNRNSKFDLPQATGRIYSYRLFYNFYYDASSMTINWYDINCHDCCSYSAPLFNNKITPYTTQDLLTQKSTTV